jgi:hypothetical protein
VRAARALLRPSSLELVGVEIYNSEDRRSEPKLEQGEGVQGAYVIIEKSSLV